MSAEEFDAAEEWEEGYRYELINGVFVVTPPPSEGERGPNDVLGYLLWTYKEHHAQGAALNYTLTEQTIATPRNRRRIDRVVWAGLGRLPHVRRDPPTIAIEFVSSRRRDRVRDYEAKREEYGEAGIAEYWIVDRFRRRMRVVCYTGGRSTEIIVAEGETYRTHLLPGFELPLARLLREADELGAAQGD